VEGSMPAMWPVAQGFPGQGRVTTDYEPTLLSGCTTYTTSPLNTWRWPVTGWSHVMTGWPTQRDTEKATEFGSTARPGREGSHLSRNLIF
jgi:hypothetical protein